MRNLIDSIAHLGGFEATLFHGTTGDLRVDHIDGSLFTTFDRACRQGDDVYECQVRLKRPYRVTGAIPHDIATIMRVGRHDGYIVDRAGYRTVVVYDDEAIEPIEYHDATCDLGDMPVEESEQLLVEFRPEQGQHLVLVTGQLAAKGLKRVMEAIAPDSFTYEVRPLDIAVAAWLTTDFIRDNIGDLDGVDLVLIPGKTIGEETELEQALRVPVMRGPVCYSEMPTFFEYQGIDVDPSGVVRPKLIVLGSSAAIYGEKLAQTYEVPLITLDGLVDDAIEDQDDPMGRKLAARRAAGEAFLHNEMAELVRARMILPDAQKGFVLVGYPTTVRDAQWLVDMSVSVDAVVDLGGGEIELSDHYRDATGYLDLTESEDIMTDLYTKVETLLQTCVKPVDPVG